MNILILKTGALGDVVRTSFIAQALKYKYGHLNPKVYWITDRKARILFLNNPYVDSVICSDEINKFKEKFFDLVISLEEEERLCKYVSSIRKRKLIQLKL